MPKQRITFRQVREVSYEFETVDGITHATARFWANSGFCGNTPIGQPGNVPVSDIASDWEPVKSDPVFPAFAEAAAREPPRRRR